MRNKSCGNKFRILKDYPYLSVRKIFSANYIIFSFFGFKLIWQLTIKVFNELNCGKFFAYINCAKFIRLKKNII